MHMMPDRALTLPTAVESWYFVCRSRDLPRGGTRAWTLPGASLVVYRGTSGRAYALAAHCAHMGTHLVHGEVIDERLRCPMHHWTYDGEGRCAAADVCRPADAAPAGQDTPSEGPETIAGALHRPVSVSPAHAASAASGALGSSQRAALRQPSFPVVERDGALFVFVGGASADPRADTGAVPAFPLPSWLDDRRGADPDAWRVSIARPVRIATCWHACAINGFDIVHFETVHQRALLEPPTIAMVGDDGIELKYVSRVTGRSLADRAMRRLARDRVRVTIQCWGGTLFVVRSEAGPFVNHLMLCLTPTETELIVTPLIAVPRTRLPGPDWIRSVATSWLFLSFLGRDLQPLSGMHLRAEAALEHDGPLATFVRWLAARPPLGPSSLSARAASAEVSSVPPLVAPSHPGSAGRSTAGSIGA